VNATTISVLLVDDHDLFRTGLRRLLEEEAEFTVLGDARRGEEAVQRARELKPDVAVMDINMPGMSGVEATPLLLEASPETAVLMLTVSDSEERVLDAILAGASGYMLKDASLFEIVGGIRAAAAGQSLIAPRVAGSLLDRLREHGADPVAPEDLPELSERERQVLELMVAGCENAEIGRQLHLSASTIKHHVSSILDKLNVDNRIQAAVFAVRNGLVEGRAASS
jgi:two-component system nitrate/nitrite response regulator NarL